MRDDNTQPRDNQQIADDSQSGHVAPRGVDQHITNRETDEDAAFEDAEDDDEDDNEDSAEGDEGID